MVIFALGALGFLITPTLVVATLNAAGSALGMPPLPSHEYQFWNVLAVAYMVLVTAFCWDAIRGGGVRTAPVRYLVIGKAASSIVSLVFFAVALHAFAFLANFVVDGLIAAGTFLLLRGYAQPDGRVAVPGS
jgi:hypothetical protein